MQIVHEELFILAIKCGGYIPRYFDNYFKCQMGGKFRRPNGPFVALSKPFPSEVHPLDCYTKVQRMDGKPIQD